MSQADVSKFSRLRLLASFGSGMLFAAGLAISGMTQPTKVVGFLDFFGQWDASLGLVMFAATLVHLVGLRWVLRRPAPVLNDGFRLPTRRDIDPRLVVGAVIFGVGWGLSGVCPGPALTSFPSGEWEFALFVASMAVGVFIYRALDATLLSPWKRQPARSS